MPYFTTQKIEKVDEIGDLTIQNTEDETHRIPPLLSGGALVIGIVLLSAGLIKRT